MQHRVLGRFLLPLSLPQEITGEFATMASVDWAAVLRRRSGRALTSRLNLHKDPARKPLKNQTTPQSKLLLKNHPLPLLLLMNHPLSLLLLKNHPLRLLLLTNHPLPLLLLKNKPPPCHPVVAFAKRQVLTRTHLEWITGVTSTATTSCFRTAQQVTVSAVVPRGRELRHTSDAINIM